MLACLCRTPRHRATGAITTCKVCHDLDRESIQKATSGYNQISDDVKYQTFDYDSLKNASIHGCRYCEILLQGVKLFITNCDPPWVKSTTWLLFRLDATSLKTSLLLHVVDRNDPVLVNKPSSAAFYYGRSRYLEFYSLSENALWPARTLPCLDLQHAVNQLTTWINACNATHENCREQLKNPPPLPSRVLDLSQDSAATSIYLKETKNARGQYMTLSHCWGDIQPISTTLDTLCERKKGFGIPQLPRTFQEAVRITKGLGIQYLWIDSLCIIQDSKEDWNIESGKMAAVYSNSYLNLSATQSKDSQGGFLKRDSGPSFKLQGEKAESLQFYVRDQGEVQEAHIDVRPWTDLPSTAAILCQRSRLLSRAWAFQEKLLSPRTVHFHCREMLWECPAKTECECGNIWDVEGAHNYHRLDKLPETRGHELDKRQQTRYRNRWFEFVENYSVLSLTHSKDRLPALAGLAKIFSVVNEGDYLAGLWKESICSGLAWDVSNRDPKLVLRRPVYRAPTWEAAMRWQLANIMFEELKANTEVIKWSWASVELAWKDKTNSESVPGAPIRYLSIEHDNNLSRVLEASCEVLSSESPFGEVKRGQMVIAAPASTPKSACTKWKRLPHNPTDPEISNDIIQIESELHFTRELMTVKLDFIPENEDLNRDNPSQIPALELRCLDLSNSTNCFNFLLLRSLPQDPSKFERIAAGIQFDFTEMVSWEMQTFTVI